MFGGAETVDTDAVLKGEALAGMRDGIGLWATGACYRMNQEW